MKVYNALLLMSWATSVAGHAYVWGININGKSMGRGDAEGSYIRKIFNNNPVKDPNSPDITCNKNKGPAQKTLEVKGGDKITVIWAHNQKDDDIIASSHKGPVQVYIAPTRTNGKGPVWIKVASDGYSNGQWATDKLIKAKGQQEFVFPHLQPGEYLIRPEIVALHEGDREGGAQFYMACVQVKVVSSSGSPLPSPGVALPGAYAKKDPGIFFNVYKKPMEAYHAPGGNVRVLQ